MSRVLNMQAKRAANRAARKEAALRGEATVVTSKYERNAYLNGYFDVLDGKSVSLKSLPRWESKEGLQSYRNKLWEYNPYVAGAWAAKRALAKGLRIAGYKGPETVCELDRFDEYIRSREEADYRAAMKREAFMRVIRQDVSSHGEAEDL